MKIIFSIALLLSGIYGAYAQATREEMAAHPERTAGIYHSYTYRPAVTTPAPAGYEAFYISHYGRHGSRWHISESVYANPLKMLRKAAAADALTAKGRSLLERMELIAADAKGRLGHLTPRGAEEHRGIAERMYASYPEIFSTRDGRVCHIESRSTIVPRCILSMAAFNERLKELNPAICATRESSERYMSYLANKPGMGRHFEAASAVSDSLMRAWLKPQRLLRSLISDEQFIAREVSDPVRTMEQLYLQVSIMQDVAHLNISLCDLFTDEELFTIWEWDNAKRYMLMGPSLRFGDDIIADAQPLLRNIVETAQEVIDGRSDVSASLRFGHDTNIIPLLALLEIEGTAARVADIDSIRGVWNDFRVTPMGTNLQLIFYRSKSGDVLVKVLLCEHEARLPFAEGPYYRWDELRSFCESKYK